MSNTDSSRKRYREFRERRKRVAGDPATQRDSQGIGDGPSRVSDGTESGTSAGGGGSRSGWKKRKYYLRQYRRWLWPYRITILTVFMLALLSAALAMVLPLATRYIIDSVLSHGTLSVTEKTSRLINVCLAMIVLLVLSQIVDTSRTYMMAVLNAKVIFRLRQKLFERFLRLPLGELHDLKSGGIVSRLSQDTDKVKGLVQMAIITPGAAGIRVILTIGALVFLSWEMAIIASAMIPPIVLINLLWIRKVRPIYRAMADARSEIDGCVTETFSGIRVVRGFRRERKEQHDYAVGHHTIIRKNLLAERLRLVVTAGWGLIIPATSLAIVGFGGHLVIQGRGTIGDIVAFQMYAFMLLMPVSQIVNSMNATQQALAAMERVFEIFEKPPEKPDQPGAVAAPLPIQEIRFEQMSFAYGTGKTVLKEINLSVPSGSTVALVGPSGGGKTTMVDLIARFHDPTEGSIRINGIDLRDIRLDSYRRLLAVVPQEVFLFDGSVSDNIAYGKRSADFDAIVQAAKRANAHEFIEHLPQGYETLIGERGVKLSGGQRQRLSLARAILADPDILILDEATSNLDTESEQLIQASLADLITDRTTFVIAHRLSTITHADLIVVINHGWIEQTGNHAELIKCDGLYKDMISRQQQLFHESDAALNWG